MAFGKFVQPLANRSERLAVDRMELGDPSGNQQLRGMLFNAISNAPTRFEQGEIIGQQRRLRKETQDAFNQEAASPSERLQQLGEAAGRAGDISKSSTLTEASGAAKRKETNQRIKDLTDLTGLIQSSYQSELKRTSDPEKALEKSNKLLSGLFDSGIGEDIQPALQFFAQSGQRFNLGGEGDLKAADIVLGATEGGQAARINKLTGDVELVFDKNKKPIMKFVSPELQAAKTRAQKEAELEVKNTAMSLKNQGYVPASMFHLTNPVFQNRIIDATDTGESFIKLRKITPKAVEEFTRLNDVENRLLKAVDNFKKFELYPDPITGRLPLFGEVAIELSKDPKFKQVRSEFGRLLLEYQHAITGAQSSFPEMQRIKSTFPNFENADEETLMRNALSIFNEVQNTKELSLQKLEELGFDIGALRKTRKKFNFEIPDSEQKSAGTRVGEFTENLKVMKSDLEKQLGRPLTLKELNLIKQRGN